MKRKKWLALLMAAGMLMSLSVTASARSFSFSIPENYIGSMQSTSMCKKMTDSTPYVKADVYTISTYYFLSPTRQSDILATNKIAISDILTHNFTWQTGYGGIGGSYCLSAYPTVMANYDAYATYGTWSE